MSEFNCPHCGRLISAVKHDTSYNIPWTPVHPMADRARHLGDTAQPAPEFTEAYRDTPARAPSKEADVSVPFWKTLITGALVGIPSGIIVVAAFEWPWWWLFAAPSGTTGLVWLIFLFKGGDTLWIRERIVNKDLNKDGHVGKPPPLRIEYEDHEDGREREVWADFVVPYKTRYAGAISFARGVVFQNESFSERTAADYGYTRDEWKTLRDTFIDNDWASWNHPTSEQQGVTLHGPGRVVLRRIAREGVPREQWLANE